MNYLVKCFDDKNNTFYFLVNSCDAYYAEIKVRNKYPTYNIHEVVKLKNLCEPYEDFTDEDFRHLGDNY